MVLVVIGERGVKNESGCDVNGGMEKRGDGGKGEERTESAHTGRERRKEKERKK